MTTLARKSALQEGRGRSAKEALRDLLEALAEVGMGVIGVTKSPRATPKGAVTAAVTQAAGRASSRVRTAMSLEAAVLDAVAQALADISNPRVAIHRSKLTAALAELNVAALQGKSNRATVVRPDGEELTTEQAAALLHVSRPYLVKLLDTKKIPLAQVTAGGQRRVLKSHVLRYQAEMRRAQEKALDAMVSESEKLGLYGQPPKKARGKAR